MPQETFVYLIAESAGGWPVKIGVASSPEARLRGLQTGNPKALMILKTWAFESRRAAHDIEQEVLEELRPYVVRGEWIEADTFGMCALIDDRIGERETRSAA